MIDQDKNINDKKTIAIIDGYGFVFRAFHSLPPLTRKDGTPVGAVYGFTNMIIKLLASLDVSHIAVVFDSGSKSFRNEIYPAYKANRPPCPPDLIPQFSIIRQAAESLNLMILEKVGFEADDLIATLAKKSYRDNFEVLIISSDKDLMQLINDKIHMYDAMKNKIIGSKEVKEKFLVAPDRVLDILSLMGDASDNIPGVRGIGPKTAAELIIEFDNFDNLLANIDLVKPQRRQDLIKQNIENAKMSKLLVTLKEDVDLGIDIDDLKLKSISGKKLIKFLQEQGFHSLVSRVKKAGLDDFDSDAQNLNQQHLEAQESEIDFSKIKKTAIDEHNLSKILEITNKNGLAIIDYELNYNQEPEFITISACAANGNLEEIFYLGLRQESEIKKAKEQSKSDLFSFNQDQDINQKQENNLQKIKDDFLKNCLIPIVKESSINKIFFDAKTIIKFFKKQEVNLQSFEDISLINHLLNSSVRSDLRELIDINLSEDIESKGFGEIFKKLASNLTSKNNSESGSKISAPIFSSQIQKIEFYSFKNYAIWQIYKILRPQIFASKLNHAYLIYEKPLLAILAEMELSGISVDVLRLRELSLEFEFEIKKLTKEIYQIAGQEFNIASTLQLSEILFNKLGLQSSKKSSKTGALSTGSGVLEELAVEGHEIAKKILNYRHFSKLKNTYSDALPKQINQKTNRIHTHFSSISTVTGRLSSSNPNLQNIPVKTIYGQKIRECFIAKKDYTLISADYSQIELRVLAHIAKIENLITAFKQDKDIHRITASQIFHLREDQVDDRLRSKAKAINFGIIYGISAFGLAKQLEISRSEAGNYIKSYLEAYPGIEAYMKDYIAIAQKSGFVATISGRKCFIREINSKNPMLKQASQRQAINAPIQGSAADIVKKATIDLHEELLTKFPSAKILLQIHDELIIEAPQNQAEEIAIFTKSIMEKATILDVPLKVDVKIARQWK